MNTWYDAKKQVFGMSANYDNVIANKMQTEPDNVRSVKKDAGTFYEWRFRVGTYEGILEVRKFKKNKDKARYLLFNDRDALCYVRNLDEDIGAI